jgi:hypothetical protein
MGTLFYGNNHAGIEFDDRTLAHLKIVLTTKLRRNESFSLSWMHPSGEGSGRSTIWVHPAIPMLYVFRTPIQPELNRDWIERLMLSANSTGGLQIIPEELQDE